MPETKKKLTKVIETLTAASTQCGHASQETNPEMLGYMGGNQKNMEIINLSKSYELLHAACEFLKAEAKKSSKFLFVGSTEITKTLAINYANKVKGFYLNYRWPAGMLTNWGTIQKQIKRLSFLKTLEEQKIHLSFSKKELSTHKKEIIKLSKIFEGMQDMESLPGAIIFATQTNNELALRECINAGIPAVSLTDTNGNPSLAAYPVIANDDSTISISYIFDRFVESIQKGYGESVL